MNSSLDSAITPDTDVLSSVPKTSVTPPQRYADAALDYFNEQEVKLTSRQVVVYYLDAIMELRTRDFSFARISAWIESECGIKVSSGFLHRVLTPVSEEDPRPKLLVELELRRKQLEAARKYETELADLKPGRPKKSITTTSATEAGGTAPGHSTNTGSITPPASDLSILNVRSSHPSVAERAAAGIAKAAARKESERLAAGTSVSGNSNTR